MSDKTGNTPSIDEIKAKVSQQTKAADEANGTAGDQVDLKAIAEEQSDFEKQVREQLRKNGKVFGLEFAPNLSTAKMHQMLMEAKALIILDEPDALVEAARPQSEHERRNAKKLENLKLVRIRISCLNPNKAGLPGEILTVHSDVVGTVKKYIPYNEAGEAYHVPHMLLKAMKRKRFLQIKDPPKGSRSSPTTKLVPEYGIEILPDLTKKELEDLKRAQGAAQAADDE